MSGKLTIITGPMFSGKTSTLITFIERDHIAERNYIVFNSALDNRYGENSINTHNGGTIIANAVETSTDMADVINSHIQMLAERSEVLETVFIDEVQFFDDGIVELIELLRDTNINVYCSGLNLDANFNSFTFKNSTRNIGELLSLADEIIKKTAICMDCKRDAVISYRKEKTTEIVVGVDNYTPLCRDCYKKR